MPSGRDPCSAKTGMGIDDILEAVIPHAAPRGDPDGAARAMIIDSWFDNYVGVVMLVRVVDGNAAEKGERIRMMATNAAYGSSIGVFTPKSQNRRDALKAGEVGFMICRHQGAGRRQGG